jgi:hypothetical protein
MLDLSELTQGPDPFDMTTGVSALFLKSGGNAPFDRNGSVLLRFRRLHARVDAAAGGAPPLSLAPQRRCLVARWSMSTLFLIVAMLLAIFGLSGISRSASDVVWLGLFLIAMFAFAFTWRSSHERPPSR